MLHAELSGDVNIGLLDTTRSSHSPIPVSHSYCLAQVQLNVCRGCAWMAKLSEMEVGPTEMNNSERTKWVHPQKTRP